MSRTYIEAAALPQYRHDKIIGALQIAAVSVKNAREYLFTFVDSQYGPKTIAKDWFERWSPAPCAGGYYVVTDGWPSYWTQARFESEHVLITPYFSRAKHMKTQTIEEFNNGPRESGLYWVLSGAGLETVAAYAHGRQEWQRIGIAGWSSVDKLNIVGVGPFLGHAPAEPPAFDVVRVVRELVLDACKIFVAANHREPTTIYVTPGIEAALGGRATIAPDGKLFAMTAVWDQNGFTLE